MTDMDEQMVETVAETLWKHSDDYGDDCLPWSQQTESLRNQFRPAARAAIREVLGSMPEPDWSEAPEWAQWWAVSAEHEAFWYAAEPKPISHMGHWSRPMTNSRVSIMQRAGRINLPLGTDWRLTLRKRPEHTK